MNRSWSISVVLFVLAFKVVAAENPTAADTTFFENKIRPVLVKECFECHSAGSKESKTKLKLDVPVTNAALITRALRSAGKKTPHHKPLPEQIVRDFEKWIKRGAPFPPIAGEVADESLWAFQPITNPVQPKVKQANWPRDDLDRFVLARMEEEKLQPAADAAPNVLIRRLYYDLIGLPPTIEQVEKFVKAHRRNSPKATEELVNELLASPQFGVRWGRHWLDVARYGESNGDDGLGRNASFPHAWRYRDYVIDAFNRDTPYDRFLAEQIAGDLLPFENGAERDRQLVATGFLAIGAKPAKAMNNNFDMDVVADQINVVSTAIMGLSVACARCHDHKHDPIPTRDYYALAGIFTSTQTLWGKAANEKLTAPATPLHELKTMKREDAKPDPTLAMTAGVPKFDKGYDKAIAALKPELHLKLESMPQGFTPKKDIKFSKENTGAFNGGWLEGALKENIDSYTVSFWFRNDIENQARAVTGYLFSRGPKGANGAPGDQIGIGGNYMGNPNYGKLFVFNGNEGGVSVLGKTVIPTRTWNHLVFVREGKRARLYLNGNPEPEFDTEVPITTKGARDIFIGGRNDFFQMTLTGNMAQFALFPRALSPKEALQLHSASGRPKSSGKVMPPQKAPKAAPINLAMGVREGKKPAEAKINKNGDSKKLGAPVPRGFLTATKMANTVKVNPAQSGRLELAQWLAHPTHPLTARVMVNRIWLHLFGQPIVDTPDDFGVYGARPTHPELLNHLARRFMAEKWSVKKLIRAIVLSRTYQLGSQATAAQTQADPENQWLTRHNRRRLDAESVRDSILQASGQLNLAPRHNSDVSQLDTLINWPPGESAVIHRPNNHRSIYLCLLRHAPPLELSAFDLPAGVRVMGRRHITTQPAHGLYLLNNPMVVNQSNLFAVQLLQEASGDTATRVNWVYRRALQRDATGEELSRAIELVKETQNELDSGTLKADRETSAWASLCQGLLASNEFRYID
jgi:hypothetical protein